MEQEITEKEQLRLEKELLHRVAQEIGRRGGLSTLKKHGKRHFKKINKISGEVKLAKKTDPLKEEIIEQIMKDME
jgi:lysyl-tRNA synthetase class II